MCIRDSPKPARRGAQYFAKAFVLASYKATTSSTIAMYMTEAWGRKPDYTKLALQDGKIRAMVFQSSDDGMVSETMKREIAEGFKGAYTGELSKTCGHFALLEDSSTIAEMLSNFLM